VSCSPPRRVARTTLVGWRVHGGGLILTRNGPGLVVIAEGAIIAVRLDEPGDPYRCCVPGCHRRSRAHLCHPCYVCYLDFDTGRLPEWLLALQREAHRQSERHRRWYAKGYHTWNMLTLAEAVDVASLDWEDEVTLLADLVTAFPPFLPGNAGRERDP
jgi:hypothetical protein